MHENVKVALIEVSNELDYSISRVGFSDANRKYLPVGVFTERDLVKWLKNRGVPVTRQNIGIDLRLLQVSSPLEYMFMNMGLSLTDHYWLKQKGLDLTWENVNLYTNNFKSAYSLDLRDDKPSIAGKTNFTPSASLKGDLKKKWIIDNRGIRRLVKGNYNNTCRQSISEVFATKMHKCQGTMPYVPYSLIEISSDKQNIIGCECPNFTSINTEFVPAIDIIDNLKKPNDMSYYEFFIRVCEEHGLNIRHFLEYQIMSDFLISNTDRHLNNFGILRRSDTLEWVSPAPIFDSGNSFFYKSSYVPIDKALLKIEVTSFLSKEVQLLSYVRNRGILSIEKLPRIDTLHKLLSVDMNTKEEVNDRIIKAYNKKVKYLYDFQNGANIWSYTYKG